DVSGKPIFVQLDKMPHLLIAGATGSGKSVCVNSIIVSLLYQNSPDELKFILVDPKRVELPHYNGIPYLLTPVITDVKKTIGALKWCIVEMEKRFELLSKTGNRNIAGYNQTHEEKMPYIVFVIDELAELMSLAQNDMEAGIVRLAQMARAVGIHLILATQRPSTEVITGLIKANIPARIAFAVASSIDSRTVLDGSGAEKLVGRGDMLYLSPEVSKPRRVQGVFLSDKEITDVIRFIKSFGEADYEIEFNGNSSVSMGGSTTGFSDDDDPLLGEVMEIIRQSGKASASLLQRRLKLGYARAARILDLLEERGIIGPSDGAKPREVFLDKLGGVGAVEFASREHDLTGELRPIEEEEEEEPSFTAFNSFEEVKSEDSDSENPLMDNKEAPEELENIPEFLTDEINDIGAEEIESNDASEDPNQNNVIAEVEMIEEVVEENSELESEEPEPFDEAEEQEEIEELEPEEKEGEEEEEKNESDKKDKNPPSPKGYGEARKKLFGEDEWT
ncbi:MAG: DNA translocase FtsK, partial [Patescibacteria group bacterium]